MTRLAQTDGQTQGALAPSTADGESRFPSSLVFSPSFGALQTTFSLSISDTLYRQHLSLDLTAVAGSERREEDDEEEEEKEATVSLST